MKLTKSHLKQLIKEELKRVMKEEYEWEKEPPRSRGLNKSQADFAKMVSDFFNKSEDPDFDYDQEIEPILSRMEQANFRQVTTAELVDEYFAICKEVKGKINPKNLDRLKNALKNVIGLQDWAINQML